ncbi:MAG: OB-fold nucleic acid binding domain-containing protein [Acidimicrobiia bacterium]|nr:OB-fold nucleic acid binding domain-containing protein [Acidimicrobiia bacterium]
MPRWEDPKTGSQVRFRQRVRVHGRVRSLRVQPMAAAPSIECVLVDDTGALSAVFFGRRTIPGLDVGSRVQVEGMAGESKGRLAILNPTYELLLSNTKATGPDRS